MVREEQFREDLFFRLSVVRLDVPRLRDRKGDTPLLVAHFLKQLSEEHGRQVHNIVPEALDALEHYPWPGNVRELRNVLESMVVLNTRGTIGVEDLPAHVLRGQEESDAEPSDELLAEGVAGPASVEEAAAAEGRTLRPRIRTLEEVEKETILQALEVCEGNRTRAAQTLGIGIRTIQRKLKEYGVP
jgi:DNA-binding NtrC family response regulator